MTVFDILKEEGRSIAWLARVTGFSPNYLYQVKGGMRKPNRTFMERSAEALKRPVEELFPHASNLTAVRNGEPAVRETAA